MIKHSSKIWFPFLLVFFEMVTYLSNDMALPAMPDMMRDFIISAHQAQWTLTAWFLGAISVQLFLGPLSDRYGRKPVLCWGGVLFVISTLICTVTHSYEIMLLARFIQGTGICFISVPGYASIHESFEQKQAIKILALMASIAVLAPAFGPILGSMVLIYFNWRWIFGFLVVWSTLSVAFLIVWMPETLAVSQRTPLNIRATLRRYGSILHNRYFLKMCFLLGLNFCGFILWIASGPFLVIDSFNYSPMFFGLFQGIIFVSYILANHLVKYLIDWLNLEKLIQLGLLTCFGASVSAFLLSWFFPAYLIGFITSFVVYAFGSGLLSAPLNRLAIEASQEPMGARMAIFSMLITSFATLGSVLVSIFYDGSLISIAALILITTLLTMILQFKK